MFPRDGSNPRQGPAAGVLGGVDELAKETNTDLGFPIPHNRARSDIL